MMSVFKAERAAVSLPRAGKHTAVCATMKPAPNGKWHHIRRRKFSIN